MLPLPLHGLSASIQTASEHFALCCWEMPWKLSSSQELVLPQPHTEAFVWAGRQGGIVLSPLERRMSG